MVSGSSAGAAAPAPGQPFRRVRIASLATYVPPRLLTNADLEKLVDTTDEWILQRTGIRERHIVDPGVATSDLAKEAALEAIRRAGLQPADIELIIVGTTTPDTIFPCTACVLQHKIGAVGAWGFDLLAACSGFVYALATASRLIVSGAQKNALVVGADVMSSIIDYTDRATCVLFGDGAGAVVLPPPPPGERHHVGIVLDPEGSRATLRGGDHGDPVSRAEVDDVVLVGDAGEVEHRVHRRLGRRDPDHVLALLAADRLERLLRTLREGEGRPGHQPQRHCHDAHDVSALHRPLLLEGGLVPAHPLRCASDTVYADAPTPVRPLPESSPDAIARTRLEALDSLLPTTRQRGDGPCAASSHGGLPATIARPRLRGIPA